MAMVESLENRRLFDITFHPIGVILNTSLTSTGTLVVNGDWRDDTVHIIVSGRNATLYRGGTAYAAVQAVVYQGVKRIYVDLGHGSDRVHFETNATTPVTVLGGNGDDRLEVHGGPATLVGGGGHDKLIGGGAVGMTFVGGRGNDRIYPTSALPDTISGGDGIDYVEALAGDVLLDTIEIGYS